MVAFDGPILAFGCHVTHVTHRNVVATEAFVVNAVPAPLVERVWALSDLHGDERLRESRLTLVPAQIVQAPLVEECPAHLECELDDVKHYGDEVLIFGRIVAASIRDDGAARPLADQYEGLEPVFFSRQGHTPASDGRSASAGDRWRLGP